MALHPSVIVEPPWMALDSGRKDTGQIILLVVNIILG